MGDLRVTILQKYLHWEDRKKNLASLDDTLLSMGETDIVILPEMFSTGFSMRPRNLAESPDGPTTQWMREKAARFNCAITGSIIIEENGKYYNRLIWMRPDGSFKKYDKRHLFSFAMEHDHYTAGKERMVTEWRGWKICPLVCYDLRFPVWSRNHPLDGADTEIVYDLLLYVANWPEARSNAWKTLLEARAHENQAYVAGVNRVGEDGNGINHTGDSGIFSPKGELLTKLNAGKEGFETVTLVKKDLEEFRNKFTPWKDKDHFELKF